MARFSLYDTRYTPYGSLDHEGLNSFSSLASDDSGIANYILFATLGKIVNGRNTNTNRIIENDEERETEDDSELKSFLINGMADEEDFAAHSWRRQSFTNHSPHSYGPEHASQYASADNDEQVTAGLTSNREPSTFSGRFKEGGKRKKKKHKEVHKNSTKRNR